MTPPGGTGRGTSAHGPLRAAEAMAADPAQQTSGPEGAWWHGTAWHGHVRHVLGEGSAPAPVAQQRAPGVRSLGSSPA